MIIWGIISSIFWAIAVAALLWVVCAFAGKLVNSSYSMSVPQHLVCFVIAENVDSPLYYCRRYLSAWRFTMRVVIVAQQQERVLFIVQKIIIKHIN